MAHAAQDSKTPVLLLKTRSTPGDAYEELFSTPRDGLDFAPSFVPVLEHRFDNDGMAALGSLLRGRGISKDPGSRYGGLIFTSQRAVEAFARLVQDGAAQRTMPGGETWPHLGDVPIYSVGPATTRALRAVDQVPPLNLFGEHTGNGDKLARFIPDHYAQWYADCATKQPRLLFVVGEQRRDVVPRTLADRGLEVDELVVYGTVVMPSFGRDFAQRLRDTAHCSARWVVVFSPTGCESVLQGLGMLDAATGKATRPSAAGPATYIATIGPTTRSYLERTFGKAPDACAEHPSPEGVWQAMAAFLRKGTGDESRTETEPRDRYAGDTTIQR